MGSMLFAVFNRAAVVAAVVVVVAVAALSMTCGSFA